MRAELQGDGRYLWVGNDAREAGESGVTVIDTAKLERVAFVPTGPGHHEIGFSEDGRYAFVTNRDGGTVTVIEVQTLTRVKDIETGEKPIALGYSPLGKALYVADGKTGEAAVVEKRVRVENSSTRA